MNYIRTRLQISLSSYWHRMSFFAAVGVGTLMQSLAYQTSVDFTERVLVFVAIGLIATIIIGGVKAETHDLKRRLDAMFFNMIIIIVAMALVVTIVELPRILT